VLAHRVLLRHALATTVFPAVHPISRHVAPASSAALHLASRPYPAPPPPSPCRAPSPHRARSSSLCAMPHPRACRVVARVLPTPLFPTRRSWPPQCATWARRCCDESVCFKYFRRFRGMLQCFIWMLHMCVYVASVSKVRCKCFWGLLKIFYMFQTYVTSVLIWMLHMFHPYIAIICSKYFSCFSSMLQ
jgi:hypothetical protein